MIIAHLTSVHGSFDTRIFHKQCKSFARAGYQIYLVVVHDRDEMCDGVQLKAVNSKSASRLGRMVKTVGQVYRAAIEVDADVYHLHDPELIPVGLVLKRRNKLVIFDSHEDYPADIMSKPWIPYFLRRLVSIVYARFEKWALPQFDALVTVHEQIAQRFRKYHHKVATVHNFPVIDESFNPPSQIHPRFVWLGLLSPIRGCIQIDDALSIVENANLDVIGPVSGFVSSSGKVNILGTFPQKVAIRLASHYLAGLVTYLPEPNHIDALPNKLFEYMAIGLPVIASDFPKWRQIVEGAKCGLLVDPNSPMEIAKAMQWFLDNQSAAREMGMNGRKAVLEKYSWASEEKILLDLYQGLQG